jgi:Spy/CpxP family protein refolding chaperone
MKTCIVVLALASAAFAQAPPGGPGGPHMNRMATMTTLLSLNSAQQATATKAFADARAAEKTVFTNMRTARTSLSAAIKKNDIGAIEQLSQQIGTYEAQMTSINSKAEAAFYATLTPEQQTKYDTLHADRGGMGGPGGRGPRGN